MLKQDRYYTYKFDSKRLKKFKYNIEISIEEAIKNEELIAQFENQIIDTIQWIKAREMSNEKIKCLESDIKKIKKEKYSKENGKKINNLQNEIYELMLIPEYITVKMDSKSDYKHLFNKGFVVNGKTYKRFNSSASQARVNTVLFIEEETLKDVIRITDNGRNKEVPIAPSKLNAYRGLYCSARRKISTPRFCVVKDYESSTEMKVNFITEVTNKYEDDILEENKTITRMFNRFDGQGLITPNMAKKWANELKLDYVPSEFCIRGSFLKGMVCVFDIVNFCKEKNNENYMIETIYKDDDGNFKLVDLRDIDVIITESQLKLWNSWSSVEEYIKCCEVNKLGWGVTLYTPKEDKHILKQNYQFLQTLNLTKEDIINLSSKFVNWIEGITYKDINYTILYLMGANTTEDKYKQYLKNGNMHWVKALILRPELIKYKYFKMKLYNSLKKRILEGSIGQIITEGNFQVLLADPYAMMEAVCGLPVNGLLGKGEHYSNYWNSRNVDLVVGSRSPLTYRSEHVKMKLKKNKDTEKWYKYLSTGIIINIHGDETSKFAGADHDFDILATTSNEIIIDGVYDNELPVVYNEPKPEKKIPTDEDLYIADVFSFNSIIGSLTNKSTTGYALLALFEEDSLEYKELLKRIKTITKAQSAQIDKTKIGKEVKGIVPKWIKYQKEIEGECEEQKQKRELENRILMDKHSYFFKNLYSSTGKDYKNYIENQKLLCLQILGITLEELLNKKELNDEEINFKNNYTKFLPVIDSNCVMNNLCKHIESINFNIKSLLNYDDETPYYNLLIDNLDDIDFNLYNELHLMYKNYMAEVRSILASGQDDSKDVNNEINLKQKSLAMNLLSVCNNEELLTKHMVKMFFVDNPKYNKDLFWNIVGDKVIDYMISKTDKIIVPVKDEKGNIEYLNERYNVKEIFINDFE